jgi:hypothetical protein
MFAGQPFLSAKPGGTASKISEQYGTLYRNDMCDNEHFMDFSLTHGTNPERSKGGPNDRPPLRTRL